MEPSIEDIATRQARNKLIKTEKEKERNLGKEFVPMIKPVSTVEIEEKPIPKFEDLVTVEKQGTKKPRKRKSYPRKKTSLPKKLTSKIKDLKGDSILIITEKPQAAAKIASALSNSKAKQTKAGSGIYFYEFNKNNENIIVTCAVGHLFSLAQDTKGTNYPIFEISWHPNSEVRKHDFTKKYYNSIEKLTKRAKQIIIATDYDVEGEVIGYNVVRYIANQADAKRMKFSSLTKEDIEKAYQNLEPTINWGHALGGETRHYLDWFYGINLSRALMNSIKTTGKFKIMSIGRVQGPTLNLIVEKEKEIQKFVPSLFWRIFIDIHEKANPNNKLTLKHTKDITEKQELEKFNNLENKECDVETKKTEQIIEPPHPFDLTTLQTEAYKFFSLTPARTLQIAQKLYLDGLISYPRTSSQKIPESINPKQILKKLEKIFPKQIKLATRTSPIEGKKSDPAHPSIFPTGEHQELTGEDKKIYELITKRFIACFCPNAKVENKTITATINNLKFKAKGLEIIEKAWMQVYITKLKENELKDMNGIGIIDKTKIEQDQTKPPKRYSPASIIKELEKRGLGTKATRANIIETLYNRNYIADNKSIKATPLGIQIINSLKKYSPIIINESLTRQIENNMEQMNQSNSKQELEKEQEKVLENSKKSLKEISNDFHEHESKIGKEIMDATKKAWEQEAKDNELNFACPNCKQGKLTIKYSPKFRRQFIACNAYPKCKTTFSLPPNRTIKKTEKFCEHCKFPIMMALSKNKRPWFFCFNQNCPSRKEAKTTPSS